MVGEARAVRALNYFYLVRAFREVPLITEPYESDSQTFNTAAASEEEGLDFVEEDLEFALENAPETFENVKERYGRIPKSAVRDLDRKSTRLNSRHYSAPRMPSVACKKEYKIRLCE